MGVSEKIFDMVKTSMLLAEKVAVLDEKINRLDQLTHNVNSRLIRVETIMEMASGQKPPQIPEA